MTGIYKSEAGRQAIEAFYRKVLARWPVTNEHVSVRTRHGETLVIACGPIDGPPVLLLHGSGSNSAVWIRDVAEWAKHYRVYAVDVIGEPGLSAQSRPPLRSGAYVDWLDDVYQHLGLTSASLIGVSLGGWLALGGAAWWHTSDIGHFANSVHLWSVELFFACMVIHLWGKFWMAAWRGHRGLTWVTGVVAFVASIGAAFTGYLTQSNFDSQWISGEAKDGINSIGVGSWFNVLNPGQMLMWHIVLLPLAVGAITVLHVVMVRRRGVVPPLGDEASS